MAEDEKKATKESLRESLPKDLRPIFDRLVEEYKFHALRLHGSPFVSYKVLHALIEEGWRPTD